METEAQKMTHNDTKNDPNWAEMTPKKTKWRKISQNDTKNAQNMPKNDTQNYQRDPKWHQTYPKMIPKIDQDDQKWHQKRSQINQDDIKNDAN